MAETTSSGVTEVSPHIAIQIESDRQRQNGRYGELREGKKNLRNLSQTVTPKIQKVPSFLGRDDSDSVQRFKPSMVSLGPILHRNSEYQSGKGYDYKRILRTAFVRESGQKLHSLKQRIEKIWQLSDCFEQHVIGGLNNGELASLLCEDGCAILQYIYRPSIHEGFEGIAQDILLLENQIPYKVLKELMSLHKDKGQLKQSIVTFIKKHANLPSQANPQLDALIDGDHVHLLDLLRKTLLVGFQEETRNKRKDLVLPSFRNVQKLKAAGILLGQSSDWFLRNIVFSRRFHLLGHLYLPPITVDKSTRLMFLNLVAYEMCPDFKNDSGPGVISYLSFLYSLINEAQDFKELRDAGVFYNSLGSDTELQTHFSEICAEFVPDRNAYTGVKEKIQEYCGTLMSEMLQFYHAYIKDSSWPLVTFMGVLLGLLFSGTQTWFKVKTWFSVSPAPAPAPQSHS